MNYRQRNGFTLIETLVVVLIILILLGILLPVLSKVRKVGQKSICRNNLKQLYYAIDGWMIDEQGGSSIDSLLKYTLPRSKSDNKFNQDENGTYYTHDRGWVAWRAFGGSNNNGPRSGQYNGNNDYWWYTMNGGNGDRAYESIREGSMFKYLGSEKGAYEVYGCPTLKSDSSIHQLSGGGRTPVRNYCMFDSASSKKYLGVKDAVKTPVFGERLFQGNSPVTRLPNCTTNNLATYHNGTSHIIYLDGHVGIHP